MRCCCKGHDWAGWLLLLLWGWEGVGRGAPRLVIMWLSCAIVYCKCGCLTYFRLVQLLFLGVEGMGCYEADMGPLQLQLYRFGCISYFGFGQLLSVGLKGHGMCMSLIV